MTTVTEMIGDRLERDKVAFVNRDPAPWEAGNKRPSRVRTLFLVRYRGNNYSVSVPKGVRHNQRGRTMLGRRRRRHGGIDGPAYRHFG